MNADHSLLHILLSHFQVGDWVEVEEDYSPGRCSEGGVGSIIRIHRGADPDQSDLMLEESTVVDVKYMLTGWVENQIPLTRLHNVPFVLKEPISRKDLRPRQQKCDRSQDSLTQVSDPRRTPVEWLKYGLESRRHEKRGWLKEALQSSSLLGRSENDVWRRVISDYKSQLAHIEGMRAFADHMNLAFEDPRRASNGGKRTTGGLWVTAKAPSQTNIPKNPLTIPYLLHAYGVSRSSFKRRVEADKRGVPIERYDTRAGPKNFFSVIVSRTAAQQKYTPRFFYVQEAIMCEDKEGFGMKYTDRIAQLGRRFDALVSRNGGISRWSRQAREHDARHQYIKQELIDALEAQVCRSYRQLSRVCLAVLNLSIPSLNLMFLIHTVHQWVVLCQDYRTLAP